MKGAKGVLINITGGSDITLFEVDEAASRIRAEVDQDAYIIIGSAFDQDLQGKMRVSVVATGIDAVSGALPQPTMLRVTDVAASPQPLSVTTPVVKAKPEKTVPIVAATTYQTTTSSQKPHSTSQITFSKLFMVHLEIP